MRLEGTYAYYDERYNLQIPIIEVDAETMCPYVIANGKWAVKIAGLHGILRDLQEAQAIVSYLLNTDGVPPIVSVSMFKAFAVQYARCYTDNSVRRLKLDIRDVFKPEDIKVKLVHNEIMKMRMDYIAHASDMDYESGAMVLYLDPVESNKQIIKQIYANNKFMDPTHILEESMELCEFMIKYIMTRLEHFGKFYDDEIEKLDLDKIYADSFLPDINDCDILFESDLME